MYNTVVATWCMACFIIFDDFSGYLYSSTFFAHAVFLHYILLYIANSIVMIDDLDKNERALI